MNVTHRLIQYIGYLKMSVKAFEVSINQPGRLQAAKQKDRNPNTDLLEIISGKYSDLNMNWIISGQGEMLKADKALIANEPQVENKTDRDLEKQLLQVQGELINCMKQNAELKESSKGARHTTPA